jgi:transketolase
MGQEENMQSKISMREAFFERIYDLAREDKDIVIVSADMGSQAVERFRRDFPAQFKTVGIAEQNMIAVAAGLAQEGKKTFAYAIAPFATSRCHEFIKLNGGLMKIPFNVVGCGAGFSYEDSGPTHHTTEDISIMRAIPNLDIFGPSDNESAAAVAEQAYCSGNPTYSRVDRQLLPDIHARGENFSRGYHVFGPGNKKVAIISTGNMVHNALEAQTQLDGAVDVIDVYRISPLGGPFVDALGSYEAVVTLEEHLLAGGLGSMVAEKIMDNGLTTTLERKGLTDYLYEYGREHIHKKEGLDAASVAQSAADYL